MANDALNTNPPNAEIHITTHGSDWVSSFVGYRPWNAWLHVSRRFCTDIPVALGCHCSDDSHRSHSCRLALHVSGTSTFFNRPVRHPCD
jgi:hypothetical protein